MTSDRISQTVSDFRGMPLPEPGRIAGYAALMEMFGLRLPIPVRLAAIAMRHHPVSTGSWLMLTPRHAPADTLAGHLAFALKWEGIDLAVLAALFRQVPPGEIATIVRRTPTGAGARRLWFLHEWLTGSTLDIPDPGKVRAVPVVDADRQLTLAGASASKRHRVIDNLPGTRAFCPMVRAHRSASRRFGHATRPARPRGDRCHAAGSRRARRELPAPERFAGVVRDRGRAPVGRSRDAMGAGDRASRRPPDRCHRTRTPAAPRHPDDRFVRLGLRDAGGFVGSHDRESGMPLPEHVSARAEDLEGLLAGIAAYDARIARHGFDPIAAAAAIAFGFVYVHPFEDGNGRLHRWLIHHVLASAGFNPPGLVFPVSAVILKRIAEYRAVLESYSQRLLPCIEWQPTPRGNVEVTNETADWYRYFDATRHAEFLYACVEQTIAGDLPREVRFLAAFDRFTAGVKQRLDMPDRTIELLRAFLEQNDGRCRGAPAMSSSRACPTTNRRGSRASIGIASRPTHRVGAARDASSAGGRQ
jgi:hypothetical protein